MYESPLAERYVTAICREIEPWNELDHPEAVDTIYFGGGTPSLLSPGQIKQILSAVKTRFEIVDNPEVTLEINPGDGRTSGVDSDGPEGAGETKFKELRRLGIDRASFGAQTFNNRELKQLGRAHDANDIEITFRELREAGFTNINFDLIAGLPGQTLAVWKRNVDKALALRPEHLSLYLLDVHEGTPLADQIARGMRPQPDEDLAAEMYATMIERLSTAGYDHYEISNFCLPGFESKHNTKYWSGAPYYGFGCSAHSYDGAHTRWANERDTARYVKMIETGGSPIIERTVLDEAARRSEAIFLGLRLMRGVNLGRYKEMFGVSLSEHYNGELNALIEAGLIEIDAETLRLTSRGALLSNEVFAALA